MIRVDKSEDYFEFNDEPKEIKIKKFNCPTPWMNYLSNGTFHTMISQAGGALAFYKSPQIWRINRYRFFHLPTDRSGLYIYIRDKETGVYWCPTAEPAFIKPEEWHASHGLGYTSFFSKYKGLEAKLTYFIGEIANCTIWKLTIKNLTSAPKHISLFSFVEFGMMEFLRELSWVNYNKHQVKAFYSETNDCIIYDYSVEMQPKPHETPLVYLATDFKVSGYDCDRDEFIGSYRSESNPQAIEDGKCSNSVLYGGDPCGALEMKMLLQPGEEKQINTFLGVAESEGEISNILNVCRNDNFVQNSWDSVQDFWGKYLENFKCELPEKSAERLINIWNPYQVHRNFLFSRNISYYATGTFRGTGFRDTSQDIISLVGFDIEGAKKKIIELLKHQYRDGHTVHYYFLTEGWEALDRRHSDNHIWPVLPVYQIVMEEGNTAFLKTIVPYRDGGQDTIFDHLLKSFKYTCSNIGENGFPLMLTSDWNDMLYKVGKEGKGESIWMSMFLGFSLERLYHLGQLINIDLSEIKVFLNQQKALVNSLGWDGEWFRRAVMDNGEYLGTKESREAQIWLNTQTWSVLSGIADQDKALAAMDSVKKYLDSDLGIRKLHPPIVSFPSKEDPLSHYNKGCGENGSVFCHANAWAVIAECLLGRGDLAWKYYSQLIPEAVIEKTGVWRYKAEPYVYSSNLFGPESNNFGLANNSWLTGTASWMYIAATQYILGITPVWDGIKIDPCLPSDWELVKITRRYRGTCYNFEIKKGTGYSKGFITITENAKVTKGNTISHEPGVIDRKILIEITQEEI